MCVNIFLEHVANRNVFGKDVVSDEILRFWFSRNRLKGCFENKQCQGYPESYTNKFV